LEFIIINLRSIFKYFLAIFIGFSISSCDTDVIQPGVNSFGNFSYPSTAGSYWFYSYKNYSSNFSHDSLRNYIPDDTLEGSGVSSFTGDTMINGIQCRIFLSEHTGGIHTHHKTWEYFFNTDTGLVELAHRITGTSFGPFSPNGGMQYKVGERIFYSLSEIFGFARTGFENTGDTMVTLNPPANCLKYPVSSYSNEWYFTNLSNFYDIRKQYKGYESVLTPAGGFTCVVVKKNYYSPSGAAEGNFEYTDYLSPIGIVKRKYTVKSIGAYTQAGELMGYFDANEESELTTYNIE
jgi:hypothetical protein